jgi:hypothetical protein
MRESPVLLLLTMKPANRSSRAAFPGHGAKQAAQEPQKEQQMYGRKILTALALAGALSLGLSGIASAAPRGGPGIHGGGGFHGGWRGGGFRGGLGGWGGGLGFGGLGYGLGYGYGYPYGDDYAYSYPYDYGYGAGCYWNGYGYVC